MGKDKETVDAKIGRVASGIHLVAACAMMATVSTREELDLAALILRRDPDRAAPRESESSVESFNRMLDVALDSANESAGCGTRAERRARLCQDLGRAAVVLIDSSKLAELIGAKLDLDGMKLAAVKPEPGPLPLLEQLEASASATAFDTVPVSALAAMTSSEDLGAELYSSEPANSGAIDVSNVND